MIRSFVTSSIMTRPGSTRSGQWANCTTGRPSEPSRERSGRASRTRRAMCSVAPGGEVDSRMMQLTTLELRDDRVGGRLDVAEVGLVAVLEGGRHRDDVRAGLGRVLLRRQHALAHGPGHVGREVGLDEGHLAAVDRVDVAVADVDADDRDAVGGQDCCGRQTDVSQADDRDRLCCRHGESFRWGRGGRGAHALRKLTGNTHLCSNGATRWGAPVRMSSRPRPSRVLSVTTSEEPSGRYEQ